MRLRIILLSLVIISIGTLTWFAGSSQMSVQAQSGATTSDVVVQPQPESSVADQLVNRASASWPWYVTRISGIVAAVSLVLLMLSGIGLLTGHTFSFFEPITAWASHRALGIAFSVSVVLHVGALYFDNFVPFGFKELLIPFSSDFRSVEIAGISLGSLYVSFGIVALYCVAAVLITSLIWVEKRPFVWKIIHLLSYLIMILVFVHALTLGTDFAGGILRWVWLAFGGLVGAAIVARIWRAYTV